MAAARTQQQRRESTRAKLLAATTACLIEHGYAGTTVGRVCKHAGVSSGGLFAHFDSKAQLVAAAAGEILRRSREDAAGDYLEIEHTDRIGDAIAVAWRLYRRHDLRAALELFVVGRTDPELAEQLDAVDVPHREHLGALIHLMLPEAAQLPDFDDVVELVLATLFGLALDVGTLRSAELRDREVALLTEMVRARLGGIETSQRSGVAGRNDGEG